MFPVRKIHEHLASFINKAKYSRCRFNWLVSLHMLLLMNCSRELESFNKKLGKGFDGHEYSTQLCSDRIMSSQYDLISLI